jgi:hypothetical protein
MAYTGRAGVSPGCPTGWSGYSPVLPGDTPTHPDFLQFRQFTCIHIISFGLLISDDMYTYPTAIPLIFLFTGGSSEGYRGLANMGKTERPPGFRTSTRVPPKTGGQLSGSGRASQQERGRK